MAFNRAFLYKVLPLGETNSLYFYNGRATVGADDTLAEIDTDDYFAAYNTIAAEPGNDGRLGFRLHDVIIALGSDAAGLLAVSKVDSDEVDTVLFQDLLM